MSVEAKLYSVLSGVNGCTFYPVQLPDSVATALPAVFGIYTKVGGTSIQNLEGDIDISRPRMQISIYATVYGTLKTIEAAVNAAMKAASVAGTLLNVSSSVPVDGFEQETRRFYTHMDFYCWDDGT